MAVLSITEVPALKALLKPLGFDVHIHDACAGQSFTLEKTGEAAGGEVRAVIESFFSQRGMSVRFYDELNFVAK